jgi:Tfp pilus assembly protein PilN
MIRINLGKTHSYTSSSTQTAVALDQAAAMAQVGPHPSVKVFVMVIFPLLLFGYQTYNIAQKEKVLIRETAKAKQIEAEVAEFGSVKNVVEDLAKEKEKLSKQLSVIKKISQKRAYKLQAIKVVQRSLLDDLWLEEMTVDRSTLIFQGLSRSPSSVQEIVDNLLRSEFVVQAFNKKMERTTLGGEDLNSFEIEAQVKN